MVKVVKLTVLKLSPIKVSNDNRIVVFKFV